MQQKRSQRDAYLRKQTEGAVLAQIGTVETFFPCIFELAYYLENPSLEKMKEAQELKHKLGITMWSEFTEDVNQGLKNVRESQA